jgi:uncharacterized protein
MSREDSNQDSKASLCLTSGSEQDDQRPRVHLLVLQPTPFCNINCDYCYLPERQVKRGMSLNTIEHLLRKLFAAHFVGPQLSIVWHAGEPLVVPLAFYEAAFCKIAELCEPYSQVSHSIQTNGVLLTQAWCDFIKKHHVNLGVSIDGPAFLHDAHRKTRSGKGTHEKVLQGIALLQRNKINFHVIAVLTRRSLDFSDEIFDFFVERGISRIGFNIEETEGIHTSSSLEERSAEEQYRIFMKRIYQRMRSDAGSVSIREFEWARNVICHKPGTTQHAGQPVPFNQQTTPFSILSVDCDGNFSTFSPELLGYQSAGYGDFILGNVATDTIESVIVAQKFQKISRDINEGVTRCKKTCEYFELCGGGAPANKYFEHGSFQRTETMYCRYVIKTPIDIVLNDLETSFRSEERAHG